MKREILFRGKTQYGEWVEGSYLQTDDNTNNPMQHRPLNLRHQIWSYWSGDWNMGGWDPMDVLPETVSQFTGLTDKNGVKIFEGDILLSESWGSNTRSKRKTHIVEWGRVGWLATGYNGEMKVKPSLDTKSDWQVIGNIHDNKELLK